MERPGEKLRQVRERLKLTYRDVAEASQKIAARRDSEEYAIALSRLADIENKGTVPTIYRIYALCAIYRLDWKEVLRWYGVPLEQLAGDGLQIGHAETHVARFAAEETALPPEAIPPGVDVDKTTFLGFLARRWGRLPMSFLAGQEPRNLQYGFVGLADWSMHPVLQPGSLLLIDPSRRKVAADGWTNELDRPIYFLEHRDGYHVGWCVSLGGKLLLERHPSAARPPVLFEYSDVDVVGQVTGVAMLLESRKRRHARSATTPARSPNP